MFCSAHGTEFEIFEKEQEAWFAEQEKAKKEAEAAAAEAAAAAAAIGIDTDSETDTEYETDGDSDHTPVNNRRKKGKRGKKATHNSAKGKGRASGNGARKRGRVAKKGGEVRKKRKYTKKKTLAGKGRGGKKSKTKATKGKERGRRTKGDQKKGRQAIDDVGMVIDLLSTEEDDGDDFEDADVHDDDDLLPLQVQTMIRGLRGSAQTERREKRMQQHFDYKQNVADRLCLKSFSYDFPLLRHSSTTPHSCHQSHQQQHMSQEREKEKEKEKEEEDGKGTIDEAEGEKNRSRVDLQEETSKESISSSGDRSDNSIYSKLGQLKEKKHVNPETCRMQRYRRDMVRRMRSYIDDKYFNSSRIWTSAVKVPRSESRKIGHSTATAEDTNANAGTEFGLAVHCDSDGKLDKEGCNDVNMKPNCGGSGNSNGNADDGSAGIDTSENKNRATSSGAQTLDGNKPFEVLSNGEEVIFYETSSIYSL